MTVKICPDCAAVNFNGVIHCHHCGFVYPLDNQRLKIVLDYKSGNLFDQLAVAEQCHLDDIKPGQFWGIVRDGRPYGVKRTKTQIRVYPQ